MNDNTNKSQLTFFNVDKQNGNTKYDISLNIHEANIFNAYSSLSKEDIEKKLTVVSFIGSTHCGKSTIIKSLLSNNYNNNNNEHTENCDNIITGGTTNQGASVPTSSNINYFDIKCESIIRLLDFEGTSAGNKLPFTEEISLPSDLSLTDYCKLRREAVAKLPSIAYAVSDIIVYIANCDFADYDTYYTKMRQIAIEYATNNIDEAEKPSLILVSNRIADINNYPDFFDINQVTNEFFELIGDDKKSLIDCYFEIKCLRIPNWNFNSNSITNISALDVFNGQINKLLRTVIAMQNNRYNYKVNIGATFPPHTWFNLFTDVINTLPNKIRMSDHLLKLLSEKTQNESLIAAINFFTCTRIDFSEYFFKISTYYGLLILALHLGRFYLLKYKHVGDALFSEKYKSEKKNFIEQTKSLFLEYTNSVRYRDKQDTSLKHKFIKIFNIDKIFGNFLNIDFNHDKFYHIIKLLEPNKSDEVNRMIDLSNILFIEIFLEFKKNIQVKQDELVEKLRIRNNICILSGLSGNNGFGCGHLCFNEKLVNGIKNLNPLVYNKLLESNIFNIGSTFIYEIGSCPLCGRIGFHY
jgi:hypothetical protein